MNKTNYENISGDLKMSDLILNNNFTILILERFGIKLGVQDKTIDEICKKSGINTEVFLLIANLHNDITFISDLTYKSSDIKMIIQYLKSTHEYYSDEMFPDIIKNMHLLKEANENPEILMVNSFFTDYKREVDRHLDFENNIVFPYILTLIHKKERVDNFSIQNYIDHHDDIENSLSDIRKLLIQHIPSKTDLKIRRRILVGLSRLEADLNIHSKIENEIVIPFVENFEKQIDR